MPRSHQYQPTDPADTVTVLVTCPHSDVTLEMVIKGRLAVQPAAGRTSRGGPLHAGGERIGQYFIIEGPRV
jgi:hypothetical protein